MTADERIEKLLNRFGQTIEDLPKPEESHKHYTYGWYTKQNLDKAARKWDGIDDNSYYFSWDVVGDYACHLCDVIDRLEIALETALTQLADDCDKCSTYDCQGNCQDFFRLSDKSLIAPELEIIDYAD